ncbi:MAG: chemotaxis protein CheX [candidate division KSB1 bacterium]|nr:chemotaxis protein CheX [candidate division KSB1 bacterium]
MGDSDSVKDKSFSASQLLCVKQAVLATFATICGVEPSYQGTGEDGAPTHAGVGIISIVGDVAWSLMLGLPRDTATALALKFAGFEIDYDSADMADVVGELANIVAGDAIARLASIGVRAEISVPTVVRGSDLELLVPVRLPSMRMRFASPEGEFWLKLASSRHDLSRNQ